MDERTPPLPAAQDIEATVRRAVEQHLGLSDGQAAPEARFIADLNADSLEVLEMLIGLEQTFGIEISDDEAAPLVTVADAVALVRGKVEARQ